MSSDDSADLDNEPITVSVVFQMSPLWLAGRSGVAYRGDLEHFAQGLCRWVAEPVAHFADVRGGDAFVAVQLTQGKRNAGHQYRDGHYHDMKTDDQASTANCENRPKGA